MVISLRITLNKILHAIVSSIIIRRTNGFLIDPGTLEDNTNRSKQSKDVILNLFGKALSLLPHGLDWSVSAELDDCN